MAKNKYNIKRRALPGSEIWGEELVKQFTDHGELLPRNCRIVPCPG